MLRCCGPRAVGAVVVEGRAEVETLDAVRGPRFAFVGGFVDDNASTDWREGVLNEVVGSVIETLVSAY